MFRLAARELARSSAERNLFSCITTASFFDEITSFRVSFRSKANNDECFLSDSVLCQANYSLDEGVGESGLELDILSCPG